MPQVFTKYRLHHLLIWMLVFGIWFYLRLGDYGPTSRALLITLIKVADLAFLVYLTNYLLIPRLLYPRKYLWFALIYVGLILLSSILKMQVIGAIMNNPLLFDWKTHWRDRIYDNLLPHFFLVTAGATVKLVADYIRQQQRMTELAREKAEAELNFLKSQINPHFLFNSLNSVYFLIDKDNKEAREALHQFSTMLRYQLYETNGDRIPIEKEMGYLRNYVDLQKLRKEERYQVELVAGAGLSGFSIEPLLLIPFVENAFKHLSHFTDSKNYIRIEAKRTDQQFWFMVENSAAADKEGKEPYSGIGLQNVRRRLELLYPGQHRLAILPMDGKFRIELQIPVTISTP